MPTTDSLTERALRAYFRADYADQPDRHSGPVRVDGVDYVHLHNCRGTLAVYRVLDSGRIRRVAPEAWPTPLQ